MDRLERLKQEMSNAKTHYRLNIVISIIMFISSMSFTVASFVLDNPDFALVSVLNLIPTFSSYISALSYESDYILKESLYNKELSNKKPS